MLESLSRIATRLRGLTSALIVLLIVLLIGAAIIIFNPGSHALQAALPAVIALLLWTLCGLVFIQTFTTVPTRPSPEMRGFPRLARRLNRGFHWLLFATFILISIAALMLTTRLLL
ncbi:hypothetical protein [Halochromatium salexigens]|uniref:Uncharacterized protein n=1 Tax=Halochromatium salexigens TaxID=49447 RepID=A0AAJ0UHZ0_HALSE|nr:hypothetical protein [Halochromatium salexigens]MBK5930862.1 hypothetical protein [Halochromatium salexigens]